MPKVLLIVGRGYVAQHIRDAAAEKFDAAPVVRYDPIATAEDISALPTGSWIVNATGYCGVSNVDDCELEPAKTWYANHAIAVHIAELCAYHDHKLLHVSSGCIFNTMHEVQWDTTPSPRGIYQMSKAAAESDVARISKDIEYIIARIRMPFSNVDCRRNYLSKFITHQKIWESPKYSMSYMPEMARLMVEDMLDNEKANRHIVHYVNDGQVSNGELAAYMNRLGMIPKREVVVSARGRSYATLTPHPKASPLWDGLVETMENWKWR